MDRATAAPATVPAFFQAAFQRLGDRPILEDRAGTVSIGTLLEGAAAAAEGLARRGVAPGDRVGLWADNSRRWILADLAIQVAGAINVPRGTDTPETEILELLAHADPSVVIVHDAKTAARFEKIRGSLPRVREVVVLDPEGATGITLDAVVAEGRGGPSFAERAARVRPDDVATIIYTSGTTGRPKGVVLTQRNFAHQLDEIPDALGIGETDVFLSILPPWHIFERTVEYVALTRGARLVYTDLRRFRQDLAEKGPTFVPSVPRVWEAVHDAVKKALAEGGPGRRRMFAAGFAVAQARARLWDLARGHVVREKGFGPGEIVARGLAALGAALLWPLDFVARKVVFKRLKALTGGRLRGAVVGGGKMPPHVDLFFRSVGVGVLVGYGLTETSPVVTVRREHRNVLHTIGTAIARVEIEIRDRETGRRLGPGETGVVFTRGPHVMRGYHKDEALTKKAIDEAGWFDTGDLGLLTPAGDLCFRGRQKETIVLAGGENVEPSRVEEALLPSPLVEQAVVVGQDRKTLAALVWPRAEVLRERLSAAKDAPVADLLKRPEALALVKEEVARRTGSGSGLRPFEVVSRVALLPEPLSTDNACLTATLKAKRHVIVERFAAQVEEAYR
jgi:long-chain acyl-CoA synthetase